MSLLLLFSAPEKRRFNHGIVLQKRVLKGLLTKNAKNIGRITDNSDFIAIFALINTNDD